jgi:hypothetical protein
MVLGNAKRSMERATYTPIERSADRTPEHAPALRRALDKHAFAASLAVTEAELKAVARQLEKSESPSSDESALGALSQLVLDPDGTRPGGVDLSALPSFADIEPGALLRIADQVAAIRRDEVKAVDELLRAVAVPNRGSEPEVDPWDHSIPDGFEELAQSIRSLPPGSVVAARSRTQEVDDDLRPDRAGDDTHGRSGDAQAVAVVPERHAPARPQTMAEPTVEQLVRLLPQAADRSAVMNLAYRNGIDVTQLTVTEFTKSASLSAQAATIGAKAFEKRMSVEPVGMLHLERVEFAPDGIERGELIHSVPLAPAEQVNITHREWSNTSNEFETIVTDFLESFSEEGVAEKSDLSQTSSSQDAHNSAFNLGVTASGGYGPVNITASAGYNVADSSSNSMQSARNSSSTITRKASARAKKEHKISFRVASAAGTADEAVQLIRNPFDDRAVRVDYYQFARKWQVDLLRYGVRLTYDLVVPEPGSDILSRVVELQALRSAMRQGFGDPAATLPWARFDLTPAQIQRTNYQTLAAQYGASIDPPPSLTDKIVRAFSRTWPNKDASQNSETTEFNVDVPDGYLVSSLAWQWRRWAWTSEPWHFNIDTDLNTWLGARGHLAIMVGTKFVSTFDLNMSVTAVLRPEVFAAWQMRAWGTLRDAAQARYEENRALLRDRLTELESELGAQDALSLRKLEREEVMKNVMRWLFGPGFTFNPPGMPPNLYNSANSVGSASWWASMLARGEVVKFLHQAIEWENMLYMLYPYFWSHTSRWELKKYLDYPDFLHAAFLKSGSARVVLPVRPGFEKDFVSFVETGSTTGLPNGHPYLTVAEEMQAFARTNYPGIRSANPEQDARPQLTPLQRKAWDDMQKILTALDAYKATNGAYPTTSEGLATLPAGLPTNDPWGNPWMYRCPGQIDTLELASYGADGTSGGVDDDADITSWATASLIGRWYEYTPTSALDIGFDEALPSE